MANSIKKGDVLTAKDVKSGHTDKGDWCFVKFEQAEKLTVWAENKDFKATTGDSIEILDICSASVSTKKVGDKFYTNMNITALLKNNGASPTADFDGADDMFGADEDFI